MTALDMANALDFEVLVEGEGAEREIQGIYCCDLLSIVMGRAQADDVWITVMGNINAVAVAVLADVSCILLSENMQFDPESLERAKQQGVCVLKTSLPTFQAAVKIAQKLDLLTETH